MAFSVKDTKELSRLLRKVKEDGGFWPDEETMRLAHGCSSMWAPELVVTENGIGETRILLCLYDGGVDEFRGMWHIPGGYASIQDKTIREACSRIARRELGVDVEYICTRSQPYLWAPGEHPYGRPLSLFVEVEPMGVVGKRSGQCFFGVRNLPDGLVSCHRRFILGNV